MNRVTTARDLCNVVIPEDRVTRFLTVPALSPGEIAKGVWAGNSTVHVFYVTSRECLTPDELELCGDQLVLNTDPDAYAGDLGTLHGLPVYSTAFLTPRFQIANGWARVVLDCWS